MSGPRTQVPESETSVFLSNLLHTTFASCLPYYSKHWTCVISLTPQHKPKRDTNASHPQVTNEETEEWMVK
jgi:hypothetical protein